MMRSAAIALDLRILSEINRKQTVGNTCKNHGLTANSMGGRSESVHTQMLANSPYTLDPHGLVRPLLVRQPWGDELFSLYWVPSSPLYPQSLSSSSSSSSPSLLKLGTGSLPSLSRNP